MIAFFALAGFQFGIGMFCMLVGVNNNTLKMPALILVPAAVLLFTLSGVNVAVGLSQKP